MAPEQALGQRVDERTDLYSAAVILYELLSGQSPFRARKLDEVIGEVVTGRWVPLGSRCPHLPESLAAVVDKMLSLNADSRYGSATEFARQLHGHLSNAPDAQRLLSLTSGDPFLLRAAESPNLQPPQRTPKARKPRKPAASHGSPQWLSQEALRRPVIPKAPLAPVIGELAEAVVTQPEGPPVPLSTERYLAQSAGNEAARHPSTRPEAPSSDASGSVPSPEAIEDGRTSADGEAHAWLDSGVPMRGTNTLRLIVWAVVGMGIGATLAFI
jgi:serine/threonine protein kinase